MNAHGCEDRAPCGGRDEGPADARFTSVEPTPRSVEDVSHNRLSERAVYRQRTNPLSHGRFVQRCPPCACCAPGRPSSLDGLAWPIGVHIRGSGRITNERAKV